MSICERFLHPEIARKSFFLGQAKLLPAEYRVIPLLAIPVVIVLALGV